LIYQTLKRNAKSQIALIIALLTEAYPYDIEDFDCSLILLYERII